MLINCWLQRIRMISQAWKGRPKSRRPLLGQLPQLELLEPRSLLTAVGFDVPLGLKQATAGAEMRFWPVRDAATSVLR